MIDNVPQTTVVPDASDASAPAGPDHIGGYKSGELQLLISADTRDRYFIARELHAKVGTQAAKGVGLGGACVGTAAALVAAFSALDVALFVPSLDLVLPGALVAGLAGLGLGAILGGLGGALVGWRIPEARIQEQDSASRGGEILLSIRPRDPDDNRWLQQEWNRHTGLSV